MAKLDLKELQDVQGLVLNSYKNMPHAAYVLLTINDPEEARSWLASRLDMIKVCNRAGVTAESNTPAQQWYVNIAFTYAGLQKIIGGGYDLGGFSREYREGMASRSSTGKQMLRRSGMLGDVGRSDPNEWEWGGVKKGTQTVHILLMLFAPDKDRVQEAIKKVAGEDGELRKHGLAKYYRTLTARLPSDKKEHFGFRDGISQPEIEGASAMISDQSPVKPRSKIRSKVSVVKAGEFIIGYKNEQNLYPVVPKAISRTDNADKPIPPKEPFCLGHNGTYLVLRELEQDVEAFENFLDAQTYAQRGKLDADWKNWLAAKMVGRWKNGAPLVRYPERQSGSIEHGQFDGSNPVHLNDFYFASEDRDGLRCPIGAHIRRSNPRDSLGSQPREALRLSKRHRLLRRGRIYGPRYEPNQKDNDKPRGLLFICLNADIAGQFEAVQHNWINNPQFAGLYDERDPLLGERPMGGGSMTIPSRPANERLEGMQEFVTVKGGAYFFMPGLKALRGLAEIQSATKSNSTALQTGQL
jgi:Dyp-type peroxidase family